MAQKVYDNGPGFLPVKTWYGNDDSIAVTFPFDTSSYTLSGEIRSSSGDLLVEPTATKYTTGTGPTLKYHCAFAITSAQNETITPGSTITLFWEVGGAGRRAFMTGPFENPAKV